MTIGLFSDSRAYSLAQAADGTLSISSQNAGVVSGLTHELTGMINGGATGSVGLSHTLADMTKVGLGVGIANRTDFTKSLPLIGAKHD